jgi:hypothetical protein
LILLTAGCLFLGWRAERARKRAQAIDAIMAAGGLVTYGGHVGESGDHFWLDLVGGPVVVKINSRLNPRLGARLSQIYNLIYLRVTGPVTGSDLQYLEGIQGRCLISLPELDRRSPRLAEFRQKHPHLKIINPSR